MKFPDLVHAVKPEPHHEMPQAAIGARYFLGFRLADARIHAHADVGDVRPRHPAQLRARCRALACTPSAWSTTRANRCSSSSTGTRCSARIRWCWDEAVKISGADPDYHRRDLWEASSPATIPNTNSGCRCSPRSRPSQVQLRHARPDQDRARGTGAGAAGGTHGPQPQPGQLLRRDRAGRVLHGTRGPGIDFSNDPLLAGRIHSYVDTQISRLGGPNFHEIPINAPIAAVHNNQRDGMHRQAIHRGRVSYEPNSLGGGCPFQAGARGFRVVAGALARRTGQGARTTREIRRALQPGDAVLRKPERRSSRPTSPPLSASN